MNMPIEVYNGYVILDRVGCVNNYSAAKDK